MLGSRQTDPGASRPPLFTSRDEGAITYLRFLPQDELPDANPCGFVGDLWRRLESVFARKQRVLVVEHPPGMLGPQSVARFRERLRRLSPECGTSSGGWSPTSPQTLALQREANVLRRFVEATTEADTFVISVFQGEVMLPFLGPALASDYRIVTSGTVFLNHCLKGGLPAIGALVWFLARHLGYGRTLHLLMEQDAVDAATALELSLVDRVVEEAHLERETRHCAERFARLPAHALLATKRLLAAASGDLESYLATEGDVFAKWIMDRGGTQR